jgi:hypothetical protein
MLKVTHASLCARHLPADNEEVLDFPAIQRHCISAALGSTRRKQARREAKALQRSLKRAGSLQQGGSVWERASARYTSCILV